MLTDAQRDAYLDRIGISSVSDPSLQALTELQLAHLRSVPFENIDVFLGNEVATDNDWTYTKVVDRGRGGWCFELNGAFAQLLESLGYHVQRLGAAVLLSGPTKIIDHLVLEVMLDQPYLVEVGFGARAPIEPLALAEAGPLTTRSGTFEFLASPQGTTLAQLVEGVPEALYRFKRVNHRPADFESASQRLQTDRSLHWSTKPFATRLLDDDGTRIVLTRDALKTTTQDGETTEAVTPSEWNNVLVERFGIEAVVPPDRLRGEQD